MGMGIGVGDGEGEGLRPEFTPYYRTPRKEAMQLRGEIADADVVADTDAYHNADADTYYRTPRKWALQLRGEIADANHTVVDVGC